MFSKLALSALAAANVASGTSFLVCLIQLRNSIADLGL